MGKIQSRIGGKTLVVIADMSIYNHVRKVEYLQEYEELPHSEYGIERWKEFCLYNRLDFNLMFSEKQKQKVFEFHKNRTFIID